MEFLNFYKNNATRKFWGDIVLFLVVIWIVLSLYSMLIPTYPAKHIIYIPPTKINVTLPEIINNSYSSSESDTKDFNTGYKTALSHISQALVLSEALGDGNPSNCLNCYSNKQGLVDYFTKRFNVIGKSSPRYIQLHTALVGDRWLNYPHFFTNDGFLFIIEKAQGKCGETNTNDPDKANCVIIVDVNGQSPPNQFSTGNKANNNYIINDRFRMIIFPDRITPAGNNENDVAEHVLYSN